MVWDAAHIVNQHPSYGAKSPVVQYTDPETKVGKQEWPYWSWLSITHKEMYDLLPKTLGSMGAGAHLPEQSCFQQKTQQNSH